MLKNKKEYIKIGGAYEIIRYNSRNVINNLILSKENVRDIISYLLEIGVELLAIKEIPLDMQEWLN